MKHIHIIYLPYEIYTYLHDALRYDMIQIETMKNYIASLLYFLYFTGVIRHLRPNIALSQDLTRTATSYQTQQIQIVQTR